MEKEYLFISLRTIKFGYNEYKNTLNKFAEDILRKTDRKIFDALQTDEEKIEFLEKTIKESNAPTDDRKMYLFIKPIK